MTSVIVCDACLTAACWQGEFMCDDSKDAGTVEMTVEELTELGREPEFWFDICAENGVAKHLINRHECRNCTRACDRAGIIMLPGSAEVLGRPGSVRS